MRKMLTEVSRNMNGKILNSTESLYFLHWCLAGVPSSKNISVSFLDSLRPLHPLQLKE